MRLSPYMAGNDCVYEIFDRNKVYQNQKFYSVIVRWLNCLYYISRFLIVLKKEIFRT
jgi:hypothetical protein